MPVSLELAQVGFHISQLISQETEEALLGQTLIHIGDSEQTAR